MKKIIRVLSIGLVFCVLFIMVGCGQINVKVKIHDTRIPYGQTVNTSYESTTESTMATSTTEEKTNQTVTEPTTVTEATTVIPTTTIPNVTEPVFTIMYAVGVVCVQDAPDVLGKIVTYLKCGEKVQKIGVDGCYTKIHYDGKELYVPTNCLSAKEPSFSNIVEVF